MKRRIGTRTYYSPLYLIAKLCLAVIFGAGIAVVGYYTWEYFWG